MRITGIATGEIQIPLARPFKTALRTVERVEDIVVRVTAENGMVGYGEAPPTAVITGDTALSLPPSTSTSPPPSPAWISSAWTR